MITFPNGKINLGLYILRKRNDGYHDIDSCFLPVPVHDILEIVPSTGKRSSFRSSGLNVYASDVDNLCVKAVKILRRDYCFPEINIHLHKIIPTKAGLGGGSSDAAFTLKMINDLFKLNISYDKLENLALEIGSDAPFFINNRPVIASGRGEVFSPAPALSENFNLIIIKPHFSVSTAAAYNSVVPCSDRVPISEVLLKPVEMWKDLLVNDFEKTVFERYPEAEKIKKLLYDSGALYASITGSGSAFYAIFDNQPKLKNTSQYHVLYTGPLSIDV